MIMLKNIKYQIVLCLVLLWTGFASAGNIMQINSAQVQANQQVSIQVVITNSDPFVAFQLDVPLPAPFAYVTSSAALNPARCNGQMISTTLMTGNILRIIGFSFNNAPFLGNSGVIATFALNAGTIPGDYILTPTNAIIGNASSVNILTGVVSGTLTLLAPNINLNPTSLDFGQIPLGNTSDQYVTVSNTGNQNLQISNITFNSPYFTVVGNTAFSIPPNGSSTVTVRFTSTVKGTYQKTMTIAGNDPDQASSTVALQAVAFAVNELHCGNMFAYSGNQANLSLSINNMEAFTGFQFDLQLPSPLAYLPGSVLLTNRKTNHFISANVLSGNVLRIVAYSPNNQPFSGNNGDVVTMSFSVNGTGGWYPLNLNNVIIGNSNGQNIVSASYNGYLEIAAANIWCDNNLNFGDVSILDTSRQILRIYNYGNDTLKVNQLQFTNTVFFSDITLPFRVNQWEYADIPVKFHPPTEGQASGTMKIFSNDPDENPKNISLSGNGFIPNYLSVMDTSCFKSDTVTVQVSAENYEPFVGFQFDISFPASMSYIPNSVTLTNRAQGHMVQASLINSTTLRVVAFSMQQLPFLGNSGAVVNLGFAVNVTGTENTLPLTLSNAIMGNSQSQNILYGTNDGEITIIRLPSVGGTITYPNADNTPLSNITLKLKNSNGNTVTTTSSDNSGNYIFDNIYNGNYSIEAITDKPWEGITSTDVLLLKKHIVHISQLNGLFLACGDVNSSGNLSVTDVLLIKKRIASIISSFPSGDWLFNNLPFAVENNNVIQNFNGIIYGDANGSYNLTKDIVAVNQQGTISIAPVYDSNGEIAVPVHVSDMPNLGAFQFTISYDANKLTFTGTDHWFADISDVTIGNPVAGKLTFVWVANDKGINITDGTLCNLRFTTKMLGKSTFSFENNPTNKEFSDYEGNLFEPEYINGTVGSTTGISELNQSISVYPNPNNGTFTLEIQPIQSLTFDVRLFNSLSVVVYQQLNIAAYGKYSTEIRSGNLAEGIYTLTVTGKDTNYIKKIVIRK